MFGLIAAMAVVFVVFRWAGTGNVLAVGVSAAILAAALVALVHAGLFGLVWAVSLLRRNREKISSASVPQGNEP